MTEHILRFAAPAKTGLASDFLAYCFAIYPPPVLEHRLQELHDFFDLDTSCYQDFQEERPQKWLKIFINDQHGAFLRILAGQHFHGAPDCRPVEVNRPASVVNTILAIG